MAVKTGFYKRSSKLLPARFFELMLYMASIHDRCSLAQASNETAESFGISISKQGIDDRIDQHAVSFMRSIFEEQLSQQIDGTIDPDYFKSFTRVTIKDSTRFDLPIRVKQHFPGCGGTETSKAGASIQYEYDVKSGKMVDIDFTAIKRTDYQDAREKAHDFLPGELKIRDLGYFNTEVLKLMNKESAFFISRLHSKILVYENDQEISFSKLYQKMIREKTTHLEIRVTIGRVERLPVRLIVDIMPEEVYQSRIVKANKEARKRGCQVGEEFKARSRFNLLITNINMECIPSRQVYQLYRIRWQIELIFKIWKSTYGIHNIQPMRYHRLMCLFYAKFILILLNFQIINLLQQKMYLQHGKLLSKDKCFKTLLRFFYKIRIVLFSPIQRIAPLLVSIIQILSKNHWLEKRKNRQNYQEIFELNISQSDI